LDAGSFVGIAAHLVGGADLLYANRERVTAQQSVDSSTIAKAALTGVALAVTGYSRVLGKKLEQADGEPVQGGTDPSPETSPDVAKVQRQLKVCQWLIPGLVGAIEVLNALHREQTAARPAGARDPRRAVQVVAGLRSRLRRPGCSVLRGDRLSGVPACHPVRNATNDRLFIRLR
jgi:hypothetical protein